MQVTEGQFNVNRADRDGVSLAYRELGAGAATPLLFVHGFGCNAGHFHRQQLHFAASRRTIAVDLRGHGVSDAPHQDYDIDGFADDLRWLCGHLGLTRPIVIGHSMGGNIALKLAVRDPGFTRAIMMIDTLIDADEAFMQGLQALARRVPKMFGPEPLYDLLSCLLFLPSDDPEVKRQALDDGMRTPWHVLVSAFGGQILRNDSIGDLRRLTVAAAYVAAHGLPLEITRITALNPGVMTAKTLGVGHFSPLLAADQINAMLQSFIDRVAADDEAAARAS
ncbi:MAG: alpha/beta hydrolase [Bradyrhizobium sp.]